MEPTNILIIGGVIAGILLIIGLVVSVRDERSLVDERLEYLEDVRGVEGGKHNPRCGLAQSTGWHVIPGDNAWLAPWLALI